ncbi:Clavaminate synthase-like, partial [Globisporangium splendens]
MQRGKRQLLLFEDAAAPRKAPKVRGTMAASAAPSPSGPRTSGDATAPSPSRRAESSHQDAFTWRSIDAQAKRLSTPELLSSQVPASAIEPTLRAPANAKVHFLTSDKASWVYYAPQWYRKVFKQQHSMDPHWKTAYTQWLDRVWDLHPPQHDAIKMFGKDVLMPRFQQVYGDTDYRFSGQTFAALPIPDDLKPCIEAVRQLVVAPIDTEAPDFYRGILVNWYANGEHYMGPHTDNEKALVPHAPVCSLSLGATRRFVFTPKDSGTKGYERLELMLCDGDLVVMGGTTQETHKHALPKMSSQKLAVGKRINVTMRCFRRP